MPMPDLKFTKKKDGREVAWFRDTQGRVRTRAGTDWVKADQVKELAEYGIQLQKAQCAAGLGSDGSAMPALKASVVVAKGLANGVFQFGRKGYAQQKSSLGLQPMRDLYGLGKGGHMLNDIRINYLDDRQATIAITTLKSRQKAKGNENRAPWWGWSPDSVQKMTARAAEIFGTGMAEYLVSMGLMSANAVVSSGRFLRRVA